LYTYMYTLSYSTRVRGTFLHAHARDLMQCS
jgi:hypothetical protein